jgi:hypothetical protein
VDRRLHDGLRDLMSLVGTVSPLLAVLLLLLDFLLAL